MDPRLPAEIVTAMGEDGDLARERLKRGCRCFIGRLEGEIATYGWVSSDPEWIGELGVEIRPRADEAYLWNCVTLPDRRRRGCFCAALSSISARLRPEGLGRLWIGSVDGRSEGALTAAGFRPVLRLQAAIGLGLRRLSVRAAEGADPQTVADALASLGPQGSPLRSGLHRARRRRH